MIWSQMARGEHGGILTFGGQMGGIIYRPNVNCLVDCAYPGDGGTAVRNCVNGKTEGCVPGCVVPGTADFSSWCNPALVKYDMFCGRRAWRPEDLGKLLEAQSRGKEPVINEVVVNGECVRRNLPHAIEAFFIKTICEVGQSCDTAVRQAHRQFVDAYGDVAPLLLMDVKERGHGGGRTYGDVLRHQMQGGSGELVTPLPL